MTTRMLWAGLLGWLMLATPQAQAETGNSCEVERTAPVAFTGEAKTDHLTVSIAGDPCSASQVTLRITDNADREVYLYEGLLLEHLPFVIYEPDLQPLVTYFAEKVIRDGFIRGTRDLPPWSSVEDYYESTNDIIIVPEQDYNRMRAVNQPIFWHAAGNATWVHVVYDSASHYGKIIMRGGVFRSDED